jgi:flagellar basal body-associated protein FliL
VHRALSLVKPVKAGNDCEELAMSVILLNVPLAVLFVALVSGLSLWLVLKHPDREPETVAAPVHQLPAYYDDGRYRRAA